jgi:hypothetical protein
MVARVRPAADHRQGSAAYWQTVERVQQYRERRAITDPDRSLGPNRPAGTWSGAATAGSAVGRSTGASNESAPSGWSSAPQTRTGWAQGPGQGGTIGPRQAVVPGREEQHKGIRAAAGGPLPALNPVKSASTYQGEVSKHAPKERRAG